MKKKLTEFLKNFPILTDEEVKFIVDKANVQSFKKKTILLREGQFAKHCYLILKGCIREYSLKDGQDKSIEFYTEGDSVTPFTSTSTQKPSTRYLECSEDCILTVNSQSLEKEMIEQIPRLKPIIQEETEKMAGELQDKLASFVTSTPEERYLNLLETRPSLLNRIPQHQIASFLAVTPESLSRIRKRLFNNK